MSITAVRTSIHCEASDVDFYQRVTKSSDPRESPFRDYLDAFVAFASIGYYYKIHEPLVQRKELTLAGYWAEQQDRLLVLLALAYSRLKEVEVDRSTKELIGGLLSTAGIVPVVEGWANAGARLVRELYDSGRLPTNRTVGLYEELSSYLAMRNGTDASID